MADDAGLARADGEPPGGAATEPGERPCGSCGKPNPRRHRFCDGCGVSLDGRPAEADFVAQPPSVGRPSGPLAPTGATPHPVRQRPTWLVYALSVTTLGLYFVWWFGASWAELKREVGDPGMKPVGHALAFFVPIYNLFRIHAHYRTLNELLGRTRLEPVLQPGGMVLAALVGGVLGQIATRPSVSGGTLLVLVMLSGLVGGWMIDQWQGAIGAYYARTRRRPTPERIHPGEWAALAAGVVLILLVAVAALVPVPA